MLNRHANTITTERRARRMPDGRRRISVRDIP
jgi:hypothetical protein